MQLSRFSNGPRLRSLVLPVILLAGVIAVPVTAAAQAAGVRPVAPISEKDAASSQQDLIRLLKLSPKLTTVVARDPSLLSDQEYVMRNNPQLGQFLLEHPEIAKNPDFYLFSRMKENDGSPDQALERAVWPDLVPVPRANSAWDRSIENVTPFLVFVCIAGALLWMVRLFEGSRRWSRTFKQQSEVHSRLIDKFSTNEELLEYMQTDAGKRFLEAMPIPLSSEPDHGFSQRVPNAVARVLLPLQIGIVLSLIGIGFLSLRNAGQDMDEPMRVIGTLVLMPGIGFILSAAASWFLARRLGLTPEVGLRRNDQ
jgi:hypothetical protein